MDLFIRVLMVLPFGWSQFEALIGHWYHIDLLENRFVVVISTFITYLLNLLTMKELKPTTVAVFIYLQPVFATVFIVSGMN
jgi:threonine/homoserine efflux transporter RhtA